jgi:carboxyl-terminal processing protease
LEAAKKDSYYDQLKDHIAGLKDKIEANKSSDLFRFKDQISFYLEEQIAFHYALAQGQAEVSLNRSKEILEAKKVLTDTGNYKRLLNGTHTQP